MNNKGVITIECYRHDLEHVEDMLTEFDSNEEAAIEGTMVANMASRETSDKDVMNGTLEFEGVLSTTLEKLFKYFDADPRINAKVEIYTK